MSNKKYIVVGVGTPTKMLNAIRQCIPEVEIVVANNREVNICGQRADIIIIDDIELDGNSLLKKKQEVWYQKHNKRKRWQR